MKLKLFLCITSSYSHLQSSPWTTGELPSPVHSKHAKTTKLHVHNFHQETPRSTKRKQNILDHNPLIQIVIMFLIYMYVKITPVNISNFSDSGRLVIWTEAFPSMKVSVRISNPSKLLLRFQMAYESKNPPREMRACLDNCGLCKN